MQAPDPVPVPLDHLLRAQPGNAVALADRDGALSFAELEALVARVAGWLAAGVAPGGRVASWLAKTRLACVLPLACARAGLVHVPVNPLLKRAQVAHILADSGAAMLIAGAARAAGLAVGDVPDGCALRIEEEDACEAAPLAPSSADPATLVQLLYTSGSTGAPKGVMLSHANLVLGARSVAHYMKLAADDRVLAVLPLSFDAGQNQLLSAWAAGACAVPLDYLAPRDVVRATDRFGITTITGVPPLWVQLAEAAWPAETSLRRIANTGGRLGVPLVRRLRALFPRTELYSMYGLTEAFRSTFLDPALVDAHPDSIGRAVPFAQVAVVRPDGTPAADGEPGELVHAGPLAAGGYWRDPARTAARFRPAPAGLAGIAIWSGDTVVRDAAGLLRFVGREDEMLKVSGNRLSPTEVEAAAVASGTTAEAVALGTPDPRLGQAVLLVARGDGAQEAALATYLKRELPGYMQPQRIVWLDELPRGPNGKLDRATLRAEYAA